MCNLTDTYDIAAFVNDLEHFICRLYGFPNNLEHFICRLHGFPTYHGISNVQLSLFKSRKKFQEPQSLPPTRESLRFHLRRANT